MNILRRIIISIIGIIVLLFSGIVIFSILLYFKKPPKRTKPKINYLKVSVIEAKKRDYVQKISGYGIVQAINQSVIKPEITGIIKWISPRLRVGTKVQEETVLVVLDKYYLNESAISAQANLEQAQSQIKTIEITKNNIAKQLKIVQRELALAKKELQRLQMLEDLKQSSKSQLDLQLLQIVRIESSIENLKSQQRLQTANMKQAKAVVKLIRAQLNIARQNLIRANIMVPYTGYIKKRYAQIGMRVTPESSLFEIVDKNNVEVPVVVDDKYFTTIKPESHACMRYQKKGDIVWEGKISRISPEINDTDRTFLAFLDIDNEQLQDKVELGSFVYVTIDGRKYEDIFVIPRAAFIKDNVFIANKANDKDEFLTAQSKTPVVLSMMEEVAIIGTNLIAGDKVILSNVEEIGNGSKIMLESKHLAMKEKN